MEYKKLGLTGLEVSRIGFGCWAIGGHGYGRVDDRESINAIRAALDLGINFFDTADVYGFGHSEEILSKGLGSSRNKVIVATKFGVAWDSNGNTYHDCSPKRVVEALEGSLRRLRLDCIPLYQIHWHDNVTPIYETLEALKKCQESGKIRYISCSNFSIDLVREALKTHRIESLQCLYNFIQRDTEQDMAECHYQFNLGVIVYGLLARGLLSGKYNLGIQFGENDTRSKCELFQAESFKENLQFVEMLKQIGTRYAKTSAQIAIRFVLENPVVTCALTGNKTRKQVEENVSALDWRFKQEDLQALRLSQGVS
jgi:aryl-alcohol dehydrogenase-like predicted oxidoreductase